VADLSLLVFDGVETNDGLNLTLGTLATVADYSGDNPIAGFFDKGAYLPDNLTGQVPSLLTTVKGEIVRLPWSNENIKPFTKYLSQRKGLISSLLKSLNFFIIRDNTSTAAKSCGQTGSRWINNYCYTIQVKNTATGGSSVLDSNTMLAFGNYGIDIQDVYQNAQACQTSTASIPLRLSSV